MPTRFGSLYKDAFTITNLYSAYETARKGKRKTFAVRNFEKNLGANIYKLCQELQNKTYNPLPYRHFTIREPKPREISAPAFRDVIVQHAIYKIIYPIFDKTFIYDSYGCRKLKGSHRAVDKLQKFMRDKNNANAYILQLDIKKFYYSINLNILKQLICKKIKDKDFVNLIMTFAKDKDNDNDNDKDNDNTLKGVPIGNLLSQLLALIYLNELDNFIKRTLKIKNYVRYVDDFILILPSYNDCLKLKNIIQKFLLNKLDLQLSKWRIAKINKGANFVGYRTWKNIRFVRKRSLYHFNTSLKTENAESLNAIIGNAIRSASFAHFYNRIINEKPHLIKQLSLIKEKNKNGFLSVSALC